MKNETVSPERGWARFGGVTAILAWAAAIWLATMCSLLIGVGSYVTEARPFDWDQLVGRVMLFFVAFGFALAVLVSGVVTFGGALVSAALHPLLLQQRSVRLRRLLYSAVFMAPVIALSVAFGAIFALSAPLVSFACVVLSVAGSVGLTWLAARAVHIDEPEGTGEGFFANSRA